MSNQNEVSSAPFSPIRKMPLDARIIGWLILVTAFMDFLFAVLLTTGISRFLTDESRLILFGTFRLASELSFGIYFFCLGLMTVVCGYGVAKGYKFGWWCMLIYSTYHIADTILIYPHNRVNASIGICISVGIIVWLVSRRKIYNIGSRKQQA